MRSPRARRAWGLCSPERAPPAVVAEEVLAQAGACKLWVARAYRRRQPSLRQRHLGPPGRLLSPNSSPHTVMNSWRKPPVVPLVQELSRTWGTEEASMARRAPSKLAAHEDLVVSTLPGRLPKAFCRCRRLKVQPCRERAVEVDEVGGCPRRRRRTGTGSCRSQCGEWENSPGLVACEEVRELAMPGSPEGTDLVCFPGNAETA